MNYRKSEAKEAARAQFRGVWAAIPTPFTPDFQVDEAGLRANMRHLTRNLRIEGVFCTGVMGEFWSLTQSERKRIVEVVVDEAKRGGCKVIAHTAHHSAHETVELTRHARDAGADALARILAKKKVNPRLGPGDVRPLRVVRCPWSCTRVQ